MEKYILFYGQSQAYWGLSNGYPAPTLVKGKWYSSNEHFYQAHKATNEADHDRIRLASGPRVARKLGNQISIREDWDTIRVDVMREGLVHKFSQHLELYELLLGTGSLPIHEDTMEDTFWGWDYGNGQDVLGKLLVEIRDAFESGWYRHDIYVKPTKQDQLVMVVFDDTERSYMTFGRFLEEDSPGHYAINLIDFVSGKIVIDHFYHDNVFVARDKDVQLYQAILDIRSKRDLRKRESLHKIL